MLDSKWTGTDADRRDMRTLNLQQVVRRNFGKISMFGFATTLLCTWELIAISLSQSLANGGTAGLFWNYIHASIGLGFIYASIAELASLIPTSGGQYYWVAVLAPRPARRYLSYITGWLCAFTWQTAVAGSAYFLAALIQALFVLNLPKYAFHSWHASLIALAYLILAVFFNTLLARQLPTVEIIFVFCHILGIVIFIPLLALTPDKRSGGGPLVEFYNQGGWSSNGVATLVGSIAPISALIGFDCSVHMSEETKDSSRTVPVTLLVGYAANVLTGFFVLMACIYTIGPLDQALQTTGFPIVNMFYIATKSYAASDVMTVVIIVAEAASGIASLAAASRQLWAFARSNGVPFSRFFAPDHLTHDLPLHSVLFSLVIPIVILLLNIGSTEVLGILLSIFESALLASYAITICCILMHRLQGRKLPNSRYSLGNGIRGIVVNICALIYLFPVFVFSFFPPMPKPAPANMNWASAMVGGVVVLATIYYILWGRKYYTPPTDTTDDYIERYQASEEDASGGMTKESVEAKRLE